MSRRTPSLGRRIFPAFALATVGVGMVHALDRPDPVGAAAAEQPIIDPNVATTVIAPATTVVQVPVTNAPGDTTPITTPTATPATPVPTPATTPTTPVTVAAAPAATNDCGALTGVGASTTISWRRDYGVISVTAKFTSSGNLCHATAQYSTYDNRSDRYESWAVPVLNKQAVAAGSANVQGVSGATAVSQAYSTSLQSAIDNKK